MAYKYIGDDPIDRANYRGPNLDWTFIFMTAPATNKGIMKTYSVHLHTAGDFKIKVFRDDGTNYVFVGESAVFTGSIGLNTMSCWIPVEVGDFIGIYLPNPGASLHCGTIGEGGTSSCYRSGDITTTTLKSDWITSNSYNSLQGTVFTRVAPL